MLTEIKEIDIIKSLQKHGIDTIENCLFQDVFKNYIEILDKEKLDYPRPKLSIDPENWFLPNEYKIMDIEGFLTDQCPAENRDRLSKELELYRKHNMVPVLKAMKYLVDVFRKNNVVWGVGRGSSVASYALYLIGIHKIDSVKYSLPISEFFKGEDHGEII